MPGTCFPKIGMCIIRLGQAFLVRKSKGAGGDWETANTHCAFASEPEEGCTETTALLRLVGPVYMYI